MSYILAYLLGNFTMTGETSVKHAASGTVTVQTYRGETGQCGVLMSHRSGEFLSSHTVKQESESRVAIYRGVSYMTNIPQRRSEEIAHYITAQRLGSDDAKSEYLILIDDNLKLQIQMIYSIDPPESWMDLHTVSCEIKSCSCKAR